MQNIKNSLDRNGTILLLFFILALAGLWIFKEKEKTVFPTSSIDLSIDKQNILKTAEDWAKRLDFNKTPIVKSIKFDSDDSSNTFLAYELGNEQADVLSRSQIPIYYWDCNFRKPFDRETLEVQISPDNKLIAFDYDLANDKKLPSLGHDEAKRKAFQFIEENLGWKEADCKIISDTKTAQINRTDYKFIWEQQKFDWHGAKLRSEVEIGGNVIKGFDHYLKRPQTWDRNYETIRTNNELLESLASIFFFALYPIAAFIFLQGLSRRNIRWRFVIWSTVLLTIVFLADSYNNFPAELANYSPDKSYKIFLLQELLSPLLYTPFIAISIAVMAGAGEIIYRRMFPEKLALENMFSKAGLKSKELRMALMIGLCWFGIMLGYQILYYWLGQKFHFWCPLEVDSYKALSTFWPWVSAVNLGAFASSNEEILYRVLMLGLTRFVVRRFWLANFLQAAAWGFMHSTYPQQPCYARGLELTIEGMLEGWLINRFGLMACIVAHYCFDAFACVTPLFSAPLALKATFIIPFLPVIGPLLASFILAKKEVSEEKDLTNKTIPLPAIDVHQAEISHWDPITRYEPLTKYKRWGIVAFTVVGIAISCGEKQFFHAVGSKESPLRITRTQAIDKARAYLIGKDFNLEGYRAASSLDYDLPGSEDIQYAYEKTGYAKTREIIRRITNAFTWNVKFVKELNPTEYICAFDQDGKLSGFSIKRGEDETGARLTEDEARKKAENFLKQFPDFAPFELDDVSKTDRKSRTDYNFTFKVPKYKIADAEFKLAVNVIGDIASDSSWGWDIPDQWTWERAKHSSRQEIGAILKVIFYVISVLVFIYWIVSLFRSNKVRWRFALALGALLTLCQIMLAVNSLNSLFYYYLNTMPLTTFFVTSAVGGTILALAMFGASVFGIAIVLAGIPATMKLKTKTLLYESFINFNKHLYVSTYRQMMLDSLLLGCLALVAMDLVSVLHEILALHFSHDVRVSLLSSEFNSIPNVFFGPLSISASLFVLLVSGPISLGLALALCRWLRLTKYWRAMAVWLAFYMLNALTSRHLSDFLVALASAFVGTSVMWLIVTRLFNRNILSLFVTLWFGYTLRLAVEVWQFGWPTFTADVITASVLVLLPFVALLYIFVVGSSNKAVMKTEKPN